MEDFSLAGLLKAFGHLSVVDSALFIYGELEQLKLLYPINNSKILNIKPYHTINKNIGVIQQFRQIITKINSYINNIQVLRLETTATQSSGQDLYLFLANTPSGDWLGISTKVSSYLQQEHYSSSIFRFKDLAISKPENKELIENLENAIIDVEFYAKELKSLTWEIAETKEALIHNLLDGMLIVTTNEVDRVFKSYWYEELEEDLDDEAREEIAKHDRVNNLIASHLTNLRLYRLSAGKIDMFFAGQTDNKD